MHTFRQPFTKATAERKVTEDDSLLDIAPCSLVEVDRRFKGAYSPYNQSDGTINETTRRYIPECYIIFILAAVKN
jgi:hypothetical protein